MNHTPGPWNFGCHGGGWYQITADDTGTKNERTDDISNQWLLANVNDCMGDESVANARLIASAPDLLEACKAVKDSILRTDMSGAVMWLRPPYQAEAIHETAYERLERVIHEAEGKQ